MFTPSRKKVDRNESEQDPPSFSFKKIRRDVRNIYLGLREFEGEVLAGETMTTLAIKLCELLKYPRYKHMVIVHSISEYRSEVLTKPILESIALKINGNKEALKNDLVIDPWTHASAEIWVPIQIVEVEHTRSRKKKKPLLRMHAKIMYGSPAGKIITQEVPTGYARKMLKDIGLPKYSSVSEDELFGCTFTAQLGMNERKQTVMLRTHVNSTQKAYNSKLHRLREDCPDHNKQWFCDVCPLGTDKCNYAVKAKSLTKRACTNGHMGYFKDDDAEYCVQCVYIRRMEHRK